MFRAILYIVCVSAWNRTRRRAARLREPRYAIGAVAGVAYLAFTLYMRHRAFSDGHGAEAARASLLRFGEPVAIFGSLCLAAAAAVSWVLPFESALLRFSGAETALLLPAPMTRRQLVTYRLLRSQIPVLTGSLIFALAYPAGSVGARACGLAGAWILLMTTRVFFAGVTLARARLRRRARGSSHEPRGRFGGEGSLLSWVALFVSLAPVLSVAAAIGVRLVNTPIPTLTEAFAVLTDVAREPLPRTWLAPYAATIGPLFASTGAPFARAMLCALLVHALAITWVIREYESSELADGAAGAALDRASTRSFGYGAYAATGLEIPLRPRGWPGAVFPWKGALQTFRIVDRRVLLRLALVVAWLAVAAGVMSRNTGLAQLLGLFAAWGTVFALLMAPQVIRLDLRQDLACLDLLKTWPLSGRTIVRGEILWPTCLVSVLAWAFGGVAWLLSDFAAAYERTLVHALAASAFILMPAIVAAQYTVHNGIAIFFPAWIPTGPTRPRGVDAMGQRLILLGATWGILAVALLPAALGAALLWRWLGSVIGAWVLPPAALAGALVVGAEVLGATSLLGRALDRLDVTKTERPE
ncbi:MAG: hypothetical protein AB7Q29_10675 [Vicinamibacterales bacterium]